MQKIYWTGQTAQAGPGALSEVARVVNAHGFLIDVKPFSDLSASLVIEIEERKIAGLYHALQACLTLNEPLLPYPDSARERTILFHLSLAQGTGLARAPVPEVPG
jgi:hypothetical protein